MRIDEQVEGLVRDGLAAVIAGDPGRSAAAVQAIVDEGDQTFDEALALCFALADQLLRDLYEGPPRPDRIAFLAESVARTEAWADLDSSTAWRFLMALAQSRDPSQVLPVAEAVRAGFVIGGWLLSTFRLENERWEGILDQSLDALENNVMQGSLAV